MKEQEAGQHDPMQEDVFLSEIPVGMTLERLIDLTEELDHLNELVILHLDNRGGYTCTEAYFTAVQPVLDTLEAEIRQHYRAGMSRNAMKEIIRDWIDRKISELQ